MKTKILVLCITLLGLLGYFSLAKSQDETKATGKSQNSILFNGWYGRIKEKWQGPLHNTVVFTWYTGLTSAENEQAYRKLVNNQRKNGVKFIGYYYSATTSYPSTNVGRFNRFPEGAIPPEAIKYSWILRDTNGQLVTWPGRKNRWFIDIGKSEVQDAILTRAIKNAKRLGANVLNLDNWNYKSFAPAGQTKEQWAEKNLALLIRARELTHQHNLKLVVNQASPFEHWHKFAPYLDGFAFEQSTHSIWLTKRNLYEMELNTYEQMMAMGKSLFLFTYIYSEIRQRYKLLNNLSCLNVI